MKENSAVTIRRLEKRLQACERELEEEKRKGHQLRLERTRTTAQRDQVRIRLIGSHLFSSIALPPEVNTNAELLLHDT